MYPFRSLKSQQVKNVDEQYIYAPNLSLDPFIVSINGYLVIIQSCTNEHTTYIVHIGTFIILFRELASTFCLSKVHSMYHLENFN